MNDFQNVKFSLKSLSLISECLTMFYESMLMTCSSTLTTYYQTYNTDTSFSKIVEIKSIFI